MEFNLKDSLISLASVIDIAPNDNEKRISYNHGKRVLALCTRFSEIMNLAEKEAAKLYVLSAFHDNGLTDISQSEFQKIIDPSRYDLNALQNHCLLGEQNIQQLPGMEDCQNVILYHHECPDGSGPFGITDEDIPQYARYIHLADEIDLNFDLSAMDDEKFIAIRHFVEKNRHHLFNDWQADLFLDCFAISDLLHFNNSEIDTLLRYILPDIRIKLNAAETKKLGLFFARIVDSKSDYVSSHSFNVAKRCQIMADYYHFDEEKAAKFFLAGAIHDIGKLKIDPSLLAKKEKLTSLEYQEIKEHAYNTYKYLSPIQGFEEITKWASCHHEKLNGTGYPFGYSANELGFEERLLACIDIYEALSEARTYKKALPHSQIIPIMRHMAEKHEIDPIILDDIDKAFKKAA